MPCGAHVQAVAQCQYAVAGLQGAPGRSPVPQGDASRADDVPSMGQASTGGAGAPVGQYGDQNTGQFGTTALQGVPRAGQQHQASPESSERSFVSAVSHHDGDPGSEAEYGSVDEADFARSYSLVSHTSSPLFCVATSEPGAYRIGYDIATLCCPILMFKAVATATNV